jgi:hypothetical protein
MSRIHYIQVCRRDKAVTPNARINDFVAIYDSLEHLMQDFQPAPVTKWSVTRRIGSRWDAEPVEEVPELKGLCWSGTTDVGEGKVIVMYETPAYRAMMEDDYLCFRNAKRA